MRKNEYRGKRIDNNEFIYGYLIGDDVIVGKIIDFDDEYFNTEFWYKVISETVGQFTGLHDKNGVEIYDGDILHLYGKDTINEYDWEAVVEFGNPNGLYSWGYQLNPITEFGYNVDILAWIEMEECGIYAEVIGNIHEVKEN